MTLDGGLSQRQRRFVAEYLVDLNGAGAAVRAGYGRRNARVQASRLLSKGNIARAIGKLHAERLDQLEVTADRVIAELARVAFVDVERTTRIRSWDKVRALELLAKHMRLVVERHEHTGARGGPIRSPPGSAFDLSKLFSEMSDEERAVLRRVLEREARKQLSETERNA